MCLKSRGRVLCAPAAMLQIIPKGNVFPRQKYVG